MTCLGYNGRTTMRLRLLVTSILLLSFATLQIRASAQRVRLVLWGVTSDENSKDRDAMIAEFERRHPEIRVSALSMGAGGMNPQKLMTAIVGGVPPDLVQQDRFTIGDWASRGAFRPLDDLIAADARSSSPYAIRQQDYVPATWAETVYQGHVYAIPNSTDDRVLFYNRQLFRQAGLDPNKPPQTWNEMITDARRLTKRSSGGGFSQMGMVPLYGQGWLYLWAWQEDGEAMAADGRTCTLANPRIVQALAAIVRWYDLLGGIDAVSSFSGGFGSDAQDPFITGQLAMQISDDGFLGRIAQYNPSLDFGVCPPPVPTARFRHTGGFAHEPTWVTWSGGFSFAIPRGSRHLKQAWEFIQWMNSPEAALIGARAQAAYNHSLGRKFVPGLSANTHANTVVLNAFKPTLSARYLNAKRLCISLLPYTRFRPVTFVGQRLWDEQVRAVDRALRHTESPLKSLQAAQRVVQIELDSVRDVNRHPLLPVEPVLWGFAVCAFAAAAALAVGVMRWLLRRRRRRRAEARAGLLFVAPWLFGFTTLTAGPILASLVLSFCDYDVLHPPRWAGAANYIAITTIDRSLVFKSLGNAIYLAVIGIPLGMVTSLSMALLLNARIRGQAWYRTFFYMPSIVPVVASAVLWSFILNSDPHRGLLNAVWLSTISRVFGVPPPGWLSVPAWAKPGLIIMGLWGAGGGMILWLAGLQSIPSTLYEAASLDGAGWWAQFYRVTIPMLSPYIFFNLIMGTIGALQTFETSYVLGNTGNGQSTGPA
ncbi:MAG TPA: extracellular solute-binding protein, partial [Chthonomonadales bacterium]|nr:extracellular solute-binding protein [Chthonomonadales bacterium]